MHVHVIVALCVSYFVTVSAFVPSFSTLAPKRHVQKICPKHGITLLLSETASWDRDDLFSRVIESGVKVGTEASTPLGLTENPSLLVAGLGILVLALGLFFVILSGPVDMETTGISARTTAPIKAPEQIDVCVPYSAAAQLMYECGGFDVDFALFEQAYITATVAMVTAKKVKRDAELAVENAEKIAEAAASELMSLKKIQ